jgi:anthranilate 1,2-dioxygenase small subunit
MISESDTPVTLTAASRQALRAEIEDFHVRYCATLDDGHLDLWPDYFSDDTVYRITSRENFDLGLPTGIVYALGKGMLRDRAYAITQTQMFAPRYIRHYVTNVFVVSATADEIVARSNYLVMQTLVEGPTTLQQAGRYEDVFVRSEGGLLLRNRQCVYDTELIANDLVYPV